MVEQKEYIDPAEELEALRSSIEDGMMIAEGGGAMPIEMSSLQKVVQKTTDEGEVTYEDDTDFTPDARYLAHFEQGGFAQIILETTGVDINNPGTPVSTGIIQSTSGKDIHVENYQTSNPDVVLSKQTDDTETVWILMNTDLAEMELM